MIQNRRILDELYRKLEAGENFTYKEAVLIYDALNKEAVALGAISHENIWDGFDVDLRIARAMRNLKPKRSKYASSTKQLRKEFSHES